VHRSRHVSVLQEIFNRQDQAWEGLIADDQHLFSVKIKVLMRDDIAKTHGSIPVDGDNDSQAVQLHAEGLIPRVLRSP